MQQETNRQKKISSLLQEELAAFFQRTVHHEGVQNMIIAVTKVRVTIDLTIAKVYLSIFPNENAKNILANIRLNMPVLKHEIATKIRHQLRKMPDLEFFIDDSLERMASIEEALKGKENPIENPSLLVKRKKL